MPLDTNSYSHHIFNKFLDLVHDAQPSMYADLYRDSSKTKVNGNNVADISNMHDKDAMNAIIQPLAGGSDFDKKLPLFEKYLNQVGPGYFAGIYIAEQLALKKLHVLSKRNHLNIEIEYQSLPNGDIAVISHAQAFAIGSIDNPEGDRKDYPLIDCTIRSILHFKESGQGLELQIIDQSREIYLHKDLDPAVKQCFQEVFIQQSYAAWFLALLLKTFSVILANLFSELQKKFKSDIIIRQKPKNDEELSSQRPGGP